jgi:hypothetical protein
VCTDGTAISTNEEASSGLRPSSVLRPFGRLYSTAPKLCIPPRRSGRFRPKAAAWTVMMKLFSRKAGRRLKVRRG